jgi:hypothetical protein
MSRVASVDVEKVSRARRAPRDAPVGAPSPGRRGAAFGCGARGSGRRRPRRADRRPVRRAVRHRRGVVKETEEDLQNRGLNCQHRPEHVSWPNTYALNRAVTGLPPLCIALTGHDPVPPKRSWRGWWWARGSRTTSLRQNRQQYTPICRHFTRDVSDGTRALDLRRDRPVRRNRPRPATTGNYRLQRAFPRRANRL